MLNYLLFTRFCLPIPKVLVLRTSHNDLPECSVAAGVRRDTGQCFLRMLTGSELMDSSSHVGSGWPIS